MTRTLLAAGSACLLALGLTFSGCTTPAGGGGSSSSVSYSCCVNGSYFDCPDADSPNDCENACTADSSQDSECE